MDKPQTTPCPACGNAARRTPCPTCNPKSTIGFTGWIAYGNPTEVVPLKDLQAHVPGAGCWCKPLWDDDEVLIHNAMDKREEYERGRKPS